MPLPMRLPLKICFSWPPFEFDPGIFFPEFLTIKFGGLSLG